MVRAVYDAFTSHALQLVSKCFGMRKDVNADLHRNQQELVREAPMRSHGLRGSGPQ